MKQALATEKPSRSSFQYTYAQKGKDRSHSSVTVSAWTTDPRQLVLGRVLFIFKLVFNWCCKIFTPPSALAPEWTILQAKLNHIILWLKPFNAFLLSQLGENMTIYMNYHKPSVTLATEAKALTPKQYPHMHIFSPPHGSNNMGHRLTNQPCCV